MNGNEIGEFIVLKKKKNNEEALNILHRMASLVKPIIKNHNFRVSKLCEFYPKNPNLLGLNVNKGLKICVRLRFPGDENSFYSMNDCIGTFLHELTHNVYGPHNGAFYSFLDKLWNEYQSLLDKGYTGEGFFSKGYRVGQNVSHNVPINELRNKTVNSALNRVRKNTLFKGSGQKLGSVISSSSTSTVKPVTKTSKCSLPNNVQARRELLAKITERRIKDMKWCASEDKDYSSQEASNAESEGTSLLDPILIESDEDIESENNNSKNKKKERENENKNENENNKKKSNLDNSLNTNGNDVIFID